MAHSFYWHDYETWGSDPRRDRPAQFAGLRTDEAFNPAGPPLVLYCRPAEDVLPQPEACLVTGITPQQALRLGVVEAEAAAAIERELVQPGTCTAGYNSIRFDDEVTRNLFYRNFIDPYAREWQNGNSRWDLIDSLRLAHALRPEGIEWPQREDGAASFRLEDLTAANGIPHSGAHDALADVEATIALARLLRQRQPRLLDYALTLRDKRRVQTLLEGPGPLLHVSARYRAERGCIAPVLVVARHPVNSNGYIVWDLRADPQPLLDLGIDALRARLFTPATELPEGVERIPLKTVATNRCPILAPMTTLTPRAAERWGIDPGRVERHAERLRAAPGLAAKVQAIHQQADRPAEIDPDLMIYSGGFFSDADRREMTRIRGLTPAELARASFPFQDFRLPQMLLRYRARNWPETLSEAEQEDWDAYRLARLTSAEGGGSIQIEEYERRLTALRQTHAGDPHKLAVLDALETWGERVMDAAA